MCSILGVSDIKTDTVELCKKTLELSHLIHHYDPNWSGIYASDNAVLVHEHLSIVDVNAGAQPLYNQQETHALAVNGEIYNHQALRAEYGDRYQLQTGSNCEVILALYQEKGSELLDDLQGMFAFALCDSEEDTYLIGRDHPGATSLYMGYDEHDQLHAVSEMRTLVPVYRAIKEFPAGSHLWSRGGKIRSYYHRDWLDYDAVKGNVTGRNKLRQTLEDSAKSHLMSGVSYDVLPSDSLDSLIIPAITEKYVARRVEDQERSEAWWLWLHSFVVGLPGSPDLETVQEVADHLGTVHHEIHFTVQEGLNAVRDMAYHTETYDVMTIRASTPIYLMSRKIKAVDIRMVLSGEGSDRVFGGYLYFHKAPNTKGLHEETVCKLPALHVYDCTHANKTMSAWNVEIHIPFLGKKLFDVAMYINPQDKMRGNGKMEKHILRECSGVYLSASVTWQQKEQSSDDVGYSWIDALKEVTAQQVSD